MIDSLQLKNIATYDNTGILIKDLKKINFIYGVNGSGMTTLTKLISNPKNPLFKDCSLNWKNNSSIKALVYNKEFRDANFGQGKMDGVFTLGKATKEQEKAIEAKNEEKKRLKEDIIKRTETLDTQKKLKLSKDESFRDSVWTDIYKKHENEFKEAFVGYMIKENFKKNLLQEFKNTLVPLVTYETLQERAKTIFGKAPEILSAINAINFDRLIEIEEQKIWDKKIVGKADVDIAKLIQRLNINDWVNEGRKFIEPEDSTCPFCQGPTITSSFKNQLENYFDESFLNDTRAVGSLTEEYNRLANNLVHLVQSIEASEKSNEASKLNQNLFSSNLKTLSAQVTSNQVLLANKTKEPSRSIKLISLKAQLDEIAALIISANTEITKHNSIVANFSKEKQNLVKSVWRYITNDHKATIQAFIDEQEIIDKAIAGIEKSLIDGNTKHKELGREIQDLSNSLTSVQPSINQINKTLSFYGFRNFSIVPSTTEPNKYKIQREDGSIAESTMSEGEITFITFLYFLQLSKGSTSETNISEERVLVIDDPICSLDSNILYVVSSLLKEIIKKINAGTGNIRQLILLTHNVHFHKEVSFKDGRNQSSNDTFYWMLRRKNHITSVQAFEMKNPIQNSYELLWSELKNRSENSSITIQNTMRRIIENYFRILGKYGDDDIIKKFADTEEQEICRSLICWINDGSHTMPDDLFIEHQSDVIERYFLVFEKIFEYMNHKEHFNMMMGSSAA